MTDQHVIDAAVLIARALAEEGRDEMVGIEALQLAGFDVGAAHRFVAFLPFAFSRPILEELGVHASPTIGVATEEGGELVISLDKQPEYAAGLDLARRHRQSPCMPQWAYKAVAESSADIDAVSNALNEGADIEGAVVAGFINGPWCAKHVLT